jgi:hypothetical protein
MNTIDLLQREIQKNKYTIEVIHLKLRDMVDVIEKNEYILQIEVLQEDNDDYVKALEVLRDFEERNC